MATGSQLMTTYYAKRIMGDNAAADASDALLQTGEHINVDTWILHRENRTNLYGIKYKYDNTETSNVNNGHDKIELYGGYQISNVNMPTAWVQLDTGDIHTIGSFNGDHLNLIGTGNTVLGYDENNTAPYIELRNSDNTKNIRISLATILNKNGITINQQDNIQSFLSVHGYLWLYSPDVDITDANNGVSSGSIIEQIQAIDSNGYDFGLIQFNAASSGAVSNLVCARNIVDSTNKYIGIYSVLNKDGTGNIYLRNNAATAQDAIACEFGSTESTITISGKTVIEYNNQWLTPARIQLNRYDTTAYTDRACVGVTNGNLHLDAYNTSGIYLNHYSSDGNIYFNGSTYYINGGNYNGNSATATKWAAAQKVYVTLGTASTTTTIQGGSTSAETIGVDGTLGVGNGGTGKASWTKGGILYASATNTLAQIADGSADKVLRATASATYSWLSYTSSSTESTLVYRDASKNFSAGTITATLSGNASSADKLKTARNINGTSFNGTAAITTANWGTARNITIKDASSTNAGTAVSVNGSAAVTLLLPSTIKASLTGDCSGSASKITNITTTDAASSSTTWRRIWIAYNDNVNGRPAYTDTFAFQTSTGTMKTGRISTFPAAGTNLYNEGIRCHASSGNWTTIMLCGPDNTGDTNTSTKSWGLFNHDGTFYINKNASDASNNSRVYANANGWYFNKAYGAVWNDFAEYRQSDINEPGRVIVPHKDGIAHLSTERLQAGGRIISDTFGFAVGASDKAKTPIGLSGRVLAYPYQEKENYTIGDAVCSAPNGTVDIMTREEIKEYPDRIIGIVNEIPDYDIWSESLACPDGGEPTTTTVNVDGRIWIDIK